MTRLDIRARMLLAALLPVSLVSTLLAVFFMAARFDDLQQAYQQRTRSLARQVALASEYGLFSSNVQQLQTLLQGVLRQPDVRWVGVFDRHGVKLVSLGDAQGGNTLVHDAHESSVLDLANQRDWLAQPVFGSTLPLDDLYEARQSQGAPASAQLGQVQLAFSRHDLNAKRHMMLLLSALIGAAGLGFGLLLGLWLSRGVTRPIQRVSQLVATIGQGDFVRANASLAHLARNDPLYTLQVQLHQMASQLAAAREDLQQQVDRATAALREKIDEVQRANLAKSRFLAAASHDLRQPVHALGLFVTRLAQLPHDATGAQLVRQLEASVLAMQNLLDGLLDMSRLEAGAVPVTPRAIAVSQLLAMLRHDLTAAAAERGLQLRIRPSGLWVMSDATLVYRLLLNLVSNALRYTHKGGVLVAARRVHGGQQVLLQVWDTGIGIAAEHQHQVFAEFYQVGNPARDRTKGLGLGLNIVQRTAELLGLPPVRLRSVPGRGSCFGVLLPAVQAPALPAPLTEPPTPISAAPDALAGVLVLVIEDDALVRAALQTLLEGWYMRVLSAAGESQALRYLAMGHRPALIVSDYLLEGGQDGLALLQQLRARLGSHIPACLVSGDTGPALMQAAQIAGLSLLHKPVRPAKLRALLRRLLEADASAAVEADQRSPLGTLQ